MASAGQIRSADFAEIKRNLDASFSHVVFEREAGADEDRRSAEIIELFSRLKKRIVKSELYLDQRGGRFMLVVTIGPKDAETIMEDLFQAGLPKDMLYYLLQGVEGKRELGCRGTGFFDDEGVYDARYCCGEKAAAPGRCLIRRESSEKEG